LRRDSNPKSLCAGTASPSHLTTYLCGRWALALRLPSTRDPHSLFCCQDPHHQAKPRKSALWIWAHPTRQAVEKATLEEGDPERGLMKSGPARGSRAPLAQKLLPSGRPASVQDHKGVKALMVPPPSMLLSLAGDSSAAGKCSCTRHRGGWRAPGTVNKPDCMAGSQSTPCYAQPV
jgi:hypothetical protein